MNGAWNVSISLCQVGDAQQFQWRDRQAVLLLEVTALSP
jgi:hypothetical protein